MLIIKTYFTPFPCVSIVEFEQVNNSWDYARLSKKLLDPALSPKQYWSILNTFWNNKKVPCIAP